MMESSSTWDIAPTADDEENCNDQLLGGPMIVFFEDESELKSHEFSSTGSPSQLSQVLFGAWVMLSTFIYGGLFAALVTWPVYSFIVIGQDAGYALILPILVEAVVFLLLVAAVAKLFWDSVANLWKAWFVGTRHLRPYSSIVPAVSIFLCIVSTPAWIGSI